MSIDPFADPYEPPAWDPSYPIPNSGNFTEKALVKIAEAWAEADGGLLTDADISILKTDLQRMALDPAALNFWESQVEKLPRGTPISIEALEEAQMHPVISHALGSARPADYITAYGGRYWTKGVVLGIPSEAAPHSEIGGRTSLAAAQSENEMRTSSAAAHSEKRNEAFFGKRNEGFSDHETR